MGVKGLWTLLEPVGRRIDVEAISSKRLAVGESLRIASGTSSTGQPALPQLLLVQRLGAWDKVLA